MTSTVASSGTAKTSVTNSCRIAGIGCLLVGLALFAVAALSCLQTMNQPAAAEHNYQLVHEHWETIAADQEQTRQLASALTTSTRQLAYTNRRLKLTLAGVSLLLAGAGGLLWAGHRARR